MRLAESGWLILVLLVPVPLLLDRARARVSWPTLGVFGKASLGARLKLGVPYLLRGLAIGCVAVALSRPQSVGGRTRVAGQGVAIVAAIDQSSSMNTADFPGELEGTGRALVSRLASARRTLARFIAGRPDDLIGLVVFANYPDLACPPTLDADFLLETVRQIKPVRPGDDGTNLGDALVLAIDALKDAPTQRKAIVLLTDGRNAPAVPQPTDPEDAADIARELGINVYTIAVGRPGVKDEDGPDLELLTRVATKGGGKAFVAGGAEELSRVFAEIDTLEKSPVKGDVRVRYREEYAPWVLAAFGLLCIDRLLSAWPLRRLP